MTMPPTPKLAEATHPPAKLAEAGERKAPVRLPLYEIDRLAALHVLNWRWHRCHTPREDGKTVYWFIPPTEKVPDWWEQPSECEEPADGPKVYKTGSSPPSFTENIAAAWSLFRHLAPMLPAHSVYEDSEGAEAQLFDHDDGESHRAYHAMGDTAAIAITLVALKACGVNVEAI